MQNASIAQTERVGARIVIQKFGRFLSGMVMPNIAAFIAWGFITALFIPTGWLPNEDLAKLVGPMIQFLLPLLIAYTGGKMIYDVRGGVVAAVATMGIIVGASQPMFLGAMVMGPFAGWAMKKVDKLFEGNIPSGFEMLVNNFSAGILGAILAVLAFLGISPIMLGITKALVAAVDVVVAAGLLPLANLFVEPAKILFLNNAINHGIFSPIGMDQAASAGSSIIFLLEPNPGPGLGVLLAYYFVGKGNARQSAPGAMIIHFLGGIHEIYFPYVLMNPRLLLAVMGGGVAGTLTFQLLGAGLVAVPAPGSIFALIAMAPKGGLFAVLAGVAVASIVSFLIASALLKMSGQNEDEDLEQASAKMQALKGTKVQESAATAAVNVNKVVFACDAGMGSSAMGASILRKKFKEAGLESITVINTAINEIPADADIVVTQKTLTDRARERVPQAEHISIENFLNSPEYEALVQRLS
ncbi:PTS mannitol transporter subunit IICB [Anaerosinus massiliensis]|uniref:PTS mannitol transporter subunit IICB n=1 Tax=Massilibacillus massiliensis TaxID=1806837 RepID=UPI000B2884F2|nr:PTS mannitol transporter subunit IICB [Massilibacillus massiliensis]